MSEITLFGVNAFTPEEKLKLNSALSHLQKVMDSPAFWEAVKVQTFTETNMPTEQIAKELYRGFFDAMIKIAPYRTWNPWSVVLAYSANGVVNLNRWKLSKLTPEELAGTIAHEYTHVLGFTHSYYNNSERPDSVPYKIGRMVSKWTP